MRVFDQGSDYRVTVSAGEVAAFARRWPCSGFDVESGISFTFDKRNGDLVDVGQQGQPDCVDGAALVALSHDAQAYGRDRLTRKCECDNTHERNGTCCQICWAVGFRHVRRGP